MVQTRAQTRAQTNALTVCSTQPVVQKTTPKVAKIPIQLEKKRDSKIPPSRKVQQPTKGIVLPPGVLTPPTVMPLSVRLPPKPPKYRQCDHNPSLGSEPSMDIEENSPHQEGIITETYVVPD